MLCLAVPVFGCFLLFLMLFSLQSHSGLPALIPFWMEPLQSQGIPEVSLLIEVCLGTFYLSF